MAAAGVLSSADSPAVRSLFAIVLVAVLAAPALANMASPTEPGTPAGEPAAALADLRIARETLALDLTPLGNGRPFATVEAVYRIVNRIGPRIVPLEFLALGDDVRAAEVWLDGRPIAADFIDSLAVPPLWRIAETTPALDGTPLPYDADDGVGTPRGLRFEVAVPRGIHEVRVRYRVRPGSFDAGDHPNRVWQLAYSLAPARRWAGFGGLDVEVRVPDGWEAATTLPLQRRGATLVGRFGSLPGDVLAVSARAPVPALYVPLRMAAYGVAMLIVLFVGYVSGRLIGPSGRRVWAALPGAFVGGVLAAASVVALTGVASDLGDSAAFGYGTVTGLIFVVGPIALVAGAAATLAVASVVARRYRSA